MSVNVNIAWQGSPVSSSRCWGRHRWGASGRAGGCSPGSSSRAHAPSCSARDCSPRCSLKRGERSITCEGFLDKSQSDNLLKSKIFVLFIDIDNLLWLLSEEIDMRSILRYETQDIFSSRQKILTNQPLKIPRFWRIKTLLYSHQSFISKVAILLSGCCFNRMFQYLYRTISSYIFTHLFAITYLTFIRQEHLMICKNTLYPSILWSSYDFEKCDSSLLTTMI